MPSESDAPEPAKEIVVGSRAFNGALGVVCSGQLPAPEPFQPGCPGAGTRILPDPVQPLRSVAWAAVAPAASSAPTLAHDTSSTRPIRRMDVLPLVVGRSAPNGPGFGPKAIARPATSAS